MKTRVGKLIFHGMKDPEVKEAAVVLEDLALNWREYVAGSEGFLTCEKRRGLFRHSVVWGDMVSHIYLHIVLYYRPRELMSEGRGEYRTPWYVSLLHHIVFPY